MIEMFSLYQYAFVLCLLAGATLCLLGNHLVARHESLQILALAQGALVGNLIGRLIFYENEFLVVVSSLICFILLKIFFVIIKIKAQINETFFIVAYLSLLSFSYLLISIFPGLEGHMSVGFFGDIVSLSQRLTLCLIVVFFFLLTFFIVFHTQLLRRTFERSVLGIDHFDILEELFFATVFVCSLYGLGFLFSVTTMIFPAVLIGLKRPNLKSFLFYSVAITIVASLGGLAFSIIFERLSTVPAQVLLMLILLSLSNIYTSKKIS